MILKELLIFNSYGLFLVSMYTSSLQVESCGMIFDRLDHFNCFCTPYLILLLPSNFHLFLAVQN